MYTFTVLCPNLETLLVVHAAAMRWSLSREGAQCERVEGREERASRVRSPSPQITSLRPSADISPLARTEPNRKVGRDSVPTWTFSGVVLRGKAWTKKDTQAGWTTSDLRGEKSCWTGESARKWSLLFFLQKLCVQEKKRRGAEKGGKSEAESR